MQPQSRILFWLLVSATIAVDLVTIQKLLDEGPTSRIVYVYDALVTSQLAAACIWAMFSTRAVWLRWLGAIVAVGVCAALGVKFAGFQFAESLGIYGSLAALLVPSLWLLRGTRWWRQATGAETAAWQFSLGQLLAAMTLVALLITALRASESLFGEYPIWKVLLVLTVSDLLVIIATVAIWAAHRHWLLRLAAAIAAAAAIGLAQTISAYFGLLGQSLVSSFESDLVPDVAYRIIMAVVLFAWLELGIPIHRRANVDPPAGEEVGQIRIN